MIKKNEKKERHREREKDSKREKMKNVLCGIECIRKGEWKCEIESGSEIMLDVHIFFEQGVYNEGREGRRVIESGGGTGSER